MEIYTLKIMFPYDEDDVPWVRTIEVSENFSLLQLHRYIPKSKVDHNQIIYYLICE